VLKIWFLLCFIIGLLPFITNTTFIATNIAFTRSYTTICFNHYTIEQYINI
jgi:hypothetical protein